MCGVSKRETGEVDRGADRAEGKGKFLIHPVTVSFRVCNKLDNKKEKFRWLPLTTVTVDVADSFSGRPSPEFFELHSYLHTTFAEERETLLKRH